MKSLCLSQLSASFVSILYLCAHVGRTWPVPGLPQYLRKIDPSTGCQSVLLEPVVAENQHAEAVAVVQCALSNLLDDICAQVQLLGPGFRVSKSTHHYGWPSPAPCPLPLDPTVSALSGMWPAVQKIPVDTCKLYHDSSESRKTQAQRGHSKHQGS